VNYLVSNLVILIIMGGTLTATLLQREFWPFSHFPMYSVTIDYRQPCTWYGIYGLVEKDGEVTEVRLNESKGFFPLDEPRLVQALGYYNVTYKGKMWAAYMEISPQFYQRKLSGLLKLYYSNLEKSSGPHLDGPLIGMRLYEIEYPDALPRSPRGEPARVTLIAEFRNN
jgi:hypothetical protein